jgi:hypothetical protein
MIDQGQPSRRGGVANTVTLIRGGSSRKSREASTEEGIGAGKRHSRHKSANRPNMAVLEKERRADVDGEPRLFTQGEYDKLAEAGILGEGDELIHGVVMVVVAQVPQTY